MQTGLVSIITPMYNGAKYVAETIESVLAQTYPNWEMIIVNDGSKDESPQIVESYSQKDSRIKLINQVNGGSASARNNAIRRAEGQYIALLDSDDLWEPNFLDEQIRFIKENNAFLVYASSKRIDLNSKEFMKPIKVPNKITYKDLCRYDYIPCLTGVYDCSNYGKYYFREELKSLRDDYAYYLDIMKNVGVAYGNQKQLASYRVLQTAATGKKLKLIKPHFNLFYKTLKFGFFKSLYNTTFWAIKGVLKYNPITNRIK